METDQTDETDPTSGSGRQCLCCLLAVAASPGNAKFCEWLWAIVGEICCSWVRSKEMGRFSLIIGILFWKEKDMISDLLSDGVSDENLKGWGDSLCVGSIYWEFVDFGVFFLERLCIVEWTQFWGSMITKWMLAVPPVINMSDLSKFLSFVFASFIQFLKWVISHVRAKANGATVIFPLSM